MKKCTFSALLALSAFAFSNAQADGGVFYSGNHNFGTAVFSEGSSTFSYHGNFQGGAFTPAGISQIGGQVALQSNAFVPTSSFGFAQSGGNVFHFTDAGHQGGMSYSTQAASVNTWSSSFGNGSASSSANFGGSTSFQPMFEMPPMPPAPPSLGEKG